jgi:uncharacterized LabA/DUF88 family protein
MATPQDNISMALFCDFENVALGVRDANYDKFDIKRVLERLLLKGSIVVKKSYCDWERYKGFKAAMHEANFELIEIPHVRQSGKNSADIRLVVDALDLCYTKSHVNTFVIISGDSDFSPLVSKLRENAKYVIGVGVKNSTSDLLIANCDEFIFYDDLVRESQRQAARRDTRDNREPQQARRTPEEEARRREELDLRRTKAVEIAAETYEALVTDRDEGGRIWASVLKEAIKRRNPGFNENYYGFRTFGNLLEEAKARGLLEFGRDEKSSAFVFRGTGVSTRPEAVNGSMNGGASEQQGAGRAPSEAREGRDANRDAGRDGREPRQQAAQPAAQDEGQAPGRDARTGRGQRGGRGRGREGAQTESTFDQDSSEAFEADDQDAALQQADQLADTPATAAPAPAPTEATERGQGREQRGRERGRGDNKRPTRNPFYPEHLPAEAKAGKASAEAALPAAQADIAPAPAPVAGTSEAAAPAERPSRGERKPAAKKASTARQGKGRSAKPASAEAGAASGSASNARTDSKAERADSPADASAGAAPAPAVSAEGNAPAKKASGRSRRPRSAKPKAGEEA